MVDVQTNILIRKPVSVVSKYASNPDNTMAWYVNIHSVEWQSPKPLQIGSLLAFKAKFLGRELAYIYEIMEWEPTKKLVMKTASGPFPMETTYTWEEKGQNSTLMTLRNRGIPSGFSSFFAPLMKFMMKRANKKDLELLKKILEEGKKSE